MWPYQHPRLQVVALRYESHLLGGSPTVNGVESNASLKYGGGDNGQSGGARSRGFDDWDEE